MDIVAKLLEFMKRAKLKVIKWLVCGFLTHATGTFKIGKFFFGPGISNLNRA